jgi:hypothetical protein
MKFPELPRWGVCIAVLVALAFVWKIVNFDIGEIDVFDWVRVYSSKHESQSLSDIYIIVALIFS